MKYYVAILGSLLLLTVAAFCVFGCNRSQNTVNSLRQDQDEPDRDASRNEAEAMRFVRLQGVIDVAHGPTTS